MVGFVWATGGQEVWASEFAGSAKFIVVIEAGDEGTQGINPFTKEPTVFKAKPERQVVRARPVKAVKDAIA